jgi:hypothetical protein
MGQRRSRRKARAACCERGRSLGASGRAPHSEGISPPAARCGCATRGFRECGVGGPGAALALSSAAGRSGGAVHPGRWPVPRVSDLHAGPRRRPVRVRGQRRGRGTVPMWGRIGDDPAVTAIDGVSQPVNRGDAVAREIYVRGNMPELGCQGESSGSPPEHSPGTGSPVIPGRAVDGQLPGMEASRPVHCGRGKRVNHGPGSAGQPGRAARAGTR